MTTRILHVSDTPIGYQQYRNTTRREDFFEAFEQTIDIARGEHPNHDNEPVDAVLHTGDLFDDLDFTTVRLNVGVRIRI